MLLDKYANSANVTQTDVQYKAGLNGTVSDNTNDIARLKTENDAQNFAEMYIQAMAENNAKDIKDHKASLTAHDAGAIAVNDPDFTDKTVLGVLKYLKSLANNLKSKVAGAIGAPLSATDTADQMESKINTIKATAATNLTAKGVAASATETMTSLVNKISQIIRGSGNATTADVLAPKTFTNDGGVQLTGTMPDYSMYPANGGYVNALSTRGDNGGSIVMEPPTGYYKQGKNGGGFGAIIAVDPNYVPANIVAGRSIFGVTGTAKQGPEYSTILETQSSQTSNQKIMPIVPVITRTNGSNATMTIEASGAIKMTAQSNDTSYYGVCNVSFDKPIDFTNVRYMLVQWDTNMSGVSNSFADFYIGIKSTKDGSMIKQDGKTMSVGTSSGTAYRSFLNVSDVSGFFYISMDNDVRPNVAGYTSLITTYVSMIYLICD